MKKNATIIWFSGVCALMCFTIIPVWILESMEDPEHHPRAVHGVQRLVEVAGRIRDGAIHMPTQKDSLKNNEHFHGLSSMKKLKETLLDGRKPRDDLRKPAAKVDNARDQKRPELKPVNKKTPSISDQQAKPQYKVSDLPQDPADWTSKPVARGVAGRPLDETPSVVGAKRAHIDCEINVDSLAYWNSPQGEEDIKFTSPFSTEQDKEGFITFSPDSGGWNNIRMSMEILFVLAAATGRTLVLPPKEPFYLLNKDKGARHRGFGDFFPLNNPSFPVKIISMQEFLELPFQKEQLQKKDSEEQIRVRDAADHCDRRKNSKSFCGPIYEYLLEVGHNPELNAVKDCVIFDEQAFEDKSSPSEEARAIAGTYCGEQRKIIYWNKNDHSHYKHLHLPAQVKEYRLLTHFYNMLYFAEPKTANYFKRFVRDHLHYNDVISCAAGKIVKAVQAEGMARGFSLDAEGGSAYSAMHVRRGDLQYKKVKIPAKEWYDNTKEVWQDKEILYIATDERNKTFFDDLAIHYELRFLDDYWELAGLSNLDPNYMGMIDTIVASRGRAFAGTWFSTFSGYINRLRGYHGMSMKDSWYSFLKKKTAVHEWNIITHSAYAFEWPDGWVGIDSDVAPSHDKF